MANVLKILGVVGRILLIIMVTISSLISLAVGYIVFAPDNLPKPFYLNYMYPTPTPTPDGLIEPTQETTEVPQVHEVKPGEGVMLDTGAKIINLAEPGGKKYIRINVVLEFDPQLTEEELAAVPAGEGEGGGVNPLITEFTNELSVRLPLINDSLITIISSKSFDDLYTAEGKENLRVELMTRVQEMLHEYKLIGVYFTEFVVE